MNDCSSVVDLNVYPCELSAHATDESLTRMKVGFGGGKCLLRNASVAAEAWRYFIIDLVGSLEWDMWSWSAWVPLCGNMDVR